MMNAMGGDPGDGTAFQGEAATNCKKVFQKFGRLIRPVGVQAVVAQTDAKTGGHPIQEDRDSQIPPTEHEECRNGPDMEENHGDGGRPIQALVLSNLKDLATHLSPIMLVIPS
jgi:hypothetical protein